MSESLLQYLRFYRDLGIQELYLPQDFHAASPRESQPAAGRAAAASGARPGGKTPLRTASAPAAGAAADVPTGPTGVASTAAGPRPAQEPVSAAAAESGKPPHDPLQVLDQIRADIGDCTRCRLHQGRNKLVFGVGNPNARLVFVGEGPGADEDAQGIPFVGRAGQLLTQMINNTAKGEGIAVTRDDVYICNVVKCRPPENRNPEPDEMDMCGPFLERQLEAIRPRAICLLGGTAVKYLLRSRQGITRLRGNWQEWRGIAVMPTYHPSFLLRPYAQAHKREAWEDLKKALHYVYDAQ